MARVLHLLPRGEAPLAPEVMRLSVEAGDEVTVALLGDAGVPAADLPAGVHARRVPGELSYEQLLEEIFGADHVITW